MQSIDAESNLTAMTFDANSNQLSVADPNSVGYTAIFDARNRETSRTDTMNAQTQTGFDANSNTVKTIDAKNASSTAIFDARDRRASFTDRIGGVTSWGLDANSNVISLTDSESHTTQFAFDPRNLKVTETYADHNPPTINDQVTFVYDGARRLQTRTDQQFDYVTLLYDMAGRLTAREYRDSTKQPTDPPNDTDSFTFDGGSHILTAVSGRYSNTLTFTYDPAGRLASESLTIGGQTYTVGRAYDAANRLSTLIYPDGSIVAQTFTARNLLGQVDYQGALAASFTYDPGGRRSARTLGDTPGTTTTWGYANGGDLIASITTPNLPSFTYTYDTNKNRTSESITGVLQPYGFSTGAAGYDADDRLIAWNRADNAHNQSWTLTKAGDWQQFVDSRVTHGRTHNAVHELTAINGSPLTYDLKGNLLSNATGGASYTWDFDNQPLQAAIGGTVTTFAYDALRRRVSKSSGTTTTVYVSTQASSGHVPLSRELVEYALAGAAAAPRRKFIFTSRVDEPLSVDDIAATYYYHPNAVGNVAFLTDAGGAIAECYAYSPYGRTTILAPDGVMVRQVSSFGNPSLFSGRRLDDETALYYYRARYFSPIFGRFLTRDPIGYDAGASDLYEFVHAQPLDNVDPSGLISSDEFVNGLPGFLNEFSPRAGARQCWRTCTRVISPPIGCVCITVCVESDLRHCCVPDKICCDPGRRKLCNVTRVEANVGLYACSSLGGRGWAVPPWPGFQTATMPAAKRPVSGLGGISNTSCPAEGHSGGICITASGGFSTWTYGARACYDFGSGNTTIDTGWGIGVGTGVSGGGVYTKTTCFMDGGCCNPAQRGSFFGGR